jgi:hypothetical protein
VRAYHARLRSGILNKNPSEDETSEEYLKLESGEFVRFADGRPIPLDYFINEPPDPDTVPLKELIRLLKLIGEPVPQDLLEQLHMETSSSQCPKSGDETFHVSGRELEHRLIDFWRWSSSEILGNALRGKLAEYIVATDVGCDSGTRQEWDAYDLVSPDGTKIEVKSSGYLQSWEQAALSKISFGIQPTADIRL